MRSATTVQSPTAGRRRLRNALRRSRDSAGLTQEHVAEAMDWSLSKVIRIETGVVSISTNDLRQLLQLYGISDSKQVAELVELARIGRRKPWWIQYRDVVPPQYLSYVGLEDESHALQLFCPCGMPGLFQTEEFGHALMKAVVPPVVATTDEDGPLTPRDAAGRVALRLMRQDKVLHRQPPVEIIAILDESILWRQVGGSEVLRRQLLHLASLGERPHIRMLVLPFASRVVTLLTPFTILKFPDPSDTDVVYTEAAFEHTVLDGGKDVESYRLVFDRLRAAALDEADSTDLITQVASKLK